MLETKFNEFVAIVKRLRKDCPWDREQTNESIKAATLEEAFEVVHAIDEKDDKELKAELGDLFLHIVLHAEIASEEKRFSLDEVISSISEKLVRRHPHVFGNVVVNGTADVVRNWEAIKLDEGRKSVLEGLPAAMPALLRAFRVQEKAAKVGFDWSRKDEVWEKVEEEIHELEDAEKNLTHSEVEEELGDLLFALTNYSRFLNINPENALRKATQKFEKRFRFIEEELEKRNRKITESNLDEMNELWEKSKSKF